MLLIGLTGSIGMGKSETAKMFVAHGVPLYDADAAVHKIYAPGGAAVAPLSEAFDDILDEQGGIDREALSKHVLGNAEAMKKLEAIVHPLVGKEQLDFITQNVENNTPMVVLDIPLLFETGGKARVDVIVVVSAPYELQRERVLNRPGMTAEKFEAIHAKQVADEEKRVGADFVIDTHKGLAHAEQEVVDIIAALKDRKGSVLEKMMGKA
ncbi:MAG: dephospho-CoA kinase [Parvibaculaceae bacterium]|jgi:dephospho-CoA kinase|nr:dephospho-CoA kinase [Parvibaculaceae bacterium]